MPTDTAALLRKKEDWAASLPEPERGRWLDFYGRFYGTDEGRGHLAWVALRAHHAAAADDRGEP